MEQEARHLPVLLDEVLEHLAPRPGGRYLDGTVGLGGHSRAILERTGGEARVLGLDRDEQALALARENLAGFGGAAHLAHASYSGFREALAEAGWDAVDGALLDLGVSSLQLDAPERGFSFAADGPLDMRMDPSGDLGLESAEGLVNRADLEELKQIIGRLGEEPMGGRIARAIVEERDREPITTTGRLAEIVAGAYPAARRAKSRRHPATKTFQALRMAVNRELDELQEFLDGVTEYVNQAGRIVIISFHSLEDRVVKHRFRDMARECVCPSWQPVCTCDGQAVLRVLTKKPVLPGEEEVARNPRARSAKLRAAEKLVPAGTGGGRA
jgi:16S rRNA (cytosine1402-N4)-methyltransferase